MESKSRTALGALVVAMLLALSIAFGCGNNANPPLGGTGIPDPGEETWRSVNEKVTCGAGAPANDCPGFYGFTVEFGGAYTAGPGPNGRAFRGVITVDEYSVLSEDARDVAALERSGGPSCSETELVPGFADRVHLTLPDGKMLQVYDRNASRVCTLTPAEANARLHSDLQAIMMRYYPVPFHPVPSPTPTPSETPSPDPTPDPSPSVSVSPSPIPSPMTFLNQKFPANPIVRYFAVSLRTGSLPSSASELVA